MNLEFSSAQQALRKEEKFRYFLALACGPNSMQPALLLAVNETSINESETAETKGSYLRRMHQSKWQKRSNMSPTCVSVI